MLFFSSSAPRLITRSPSPTTIEYTVTTAALPPASRITRYLLLLLTVWLRLLCVGIWACIGTVKWHGEHRDSAAQDYLLWEWLEAGAAGRAAGKLEWWHVLLGGCMTVLAVGRRGYTEESLLVMRNLGIQTRTIPASAFSFLPAVFCSGASGTTRFIPTSQIQDVWIHEGFKGFEVRFYLGVVVKGEEEIVVVFPETLPRREVLEVVWRGLRGCLYEREIADGVGLGEAKN